MPHYMVQFKYTSESLKAMMATPQDRTPAVRRVVEHYGGKLHGLFMCFGEYDGVGITEFPDAASATASLMAINAAGGVSATATTVLLTMDEAVEAMRQAGATTSGYEPPRG